MFKKAGLGLIILLVLIVVFNRINQITDALSASERLTKLADRIFELEIKNKELKKKLSEIKSKEFIEEQARNELGLAKEGEVLVIIPDEKIKEILGATKAAEPKLPNWQGWLRVFLH